MFTHLDNVQIEELKTINEDNRRLYVTPDGTKYPSVTTVLGWSKQASIQKWRKSVGEENANRISSKAATRGTRIHYLCEDYLDNKELEFKTPLEKDMFGSFKHLLDNIDNIHLQEKTLYSDHLQTAGRVDCIGEYNGRLSIIDFKTSSKPKKLEWIQDYFMQGACYAVMYEERTGIAVDTIAILIAVEGEDSQEFVVKRDDYIQKYIDVRTAYRERFKI